MSRGQQFSLGELVNLAQQAGWSADEAPTIAAVAMAESGGRAGSLNNNPATGDLSYGLTQVNMIDRLGPARLKQFGLRSNEDLYDPLTNLRAAKAIRDSQGWNAWSVVKGGQYKQFLPGAQQALRDGGGANFGGLDLGLLSSASPAAAPTSGNDFNLGALAAAALAPAAVSEAAGGRAAVERYAGEDPVATALVAAVMGGGAPARTENAAVSTLPAVQAAGGEIGLVDFGKQLQQAGLRVGEHPAFGRVGKHSPNSYHYSGNALDITDWNSGDWRARKQFIGDVARRALGGSAEIFHPGYDPVGGHQSHIHFALPTGKMPEQAAQQILAGVQEAFRRYPRAKG